MFDVDVDLDLESFSELCIETLDKNLNALDLIKEDGYTWKSAYLDDFDKCKITKIDTDGNEVSYVILDSDDNSIKVSNENDKNLMKVATLLKIGTIL